MLPEQDGGGRKVARGGRTGALDGDGEWPERVGGLDHGRRGGVAVGVPEE